MSKESRKPRKKLLEAARKHQDALQAAGLSVTVLERYENAIRGMQAQGKISGAAEVLVKDIQREAAEFQAAMKKEFPGNAGFLGAFKAQEPMPKEPREVLALGRHIASEAPGFAQNLIRYAINAATVKHLSSLCDQLQKEIGGADPAQDAKALEEQILGAARRAFEGKPELGQFESS